MKQLEFIVDSLNIRFRSCELNKTYYSLYQAKAHFISMEEGRMDEAKKDFEDGIPFEKFVQKYPKAKVDRDLLILRHKFKNYEDNNYIEFASILNEHSISFQEMPGTSLQPQKGKWLFNSWERDEFISGSIRAFYFTQEFKKDTLPDKYARLVQYADCMVDTSTQIFIEREKPTSYTYDPNQPLKVGQFISYIYEVTDKPKPEKEEMNETEWDAFWEKQELWDSLRVIQLENDISKREEFSTLLQEAVNEALEIGGSSDEFEAYVSQYYSKKAALRLKRERRVIGSCSRDYSPRLHAINIAVLSAETVNWETFLRAHLDIMNDRFERASDGSYAWASRNTYLKELEELEINVSDLLLGISLRIENPSQNHYYGSIGRIGRALADTQYPEEIEAKMLEMIEDDQLDDYNRILIYFLFATYNNYLKDEEKQDENLIRLKLAIESLPNYLKEKILVQEKND